MTIKKYFIVYYFLALFFSQAQAQNFGIKIIQVYPRSEVMYAGAYNLSGELDKAEVSLRQQYVGRDANYIMESTRPSGKKTASIQNINWIRVVNGKKENFKSKPNLEKSYSQPTKVEIYACDNDGSKKDSKDNTIISYGHYYQFFIDEIEQTPCKGSYYYLPDLCRNDAKTCFDNSKTEGGSLFCEVKIFNEMNNVVDSINNRKEYEQFSNEQTDKWQLATEVQEDVQPQQPDDARFDCEEILRNLKIYKKKEIFMEVLSCIVIDSTYSWENVTDCLELYKKAVDVYWEDKKYDRSALFFLRDKLETIVAVMNSGSKKKPVQNSVNDFTKNGKKKKIIAEIDKLLKINNNIE